MTERGGPDELFEAPPPACEDDYGNVSPQVVAAPDAVAEFTSPVEPRLTLDPSNPLPSARAFIERNYTTGDHRTLVHHAGQFFGWSGAHYPVIEDADIRAGIYTFLEGAVRKTEKKLVPFKPTTSKVNNVLDALKAAANLPTSITAPAWLDGDSDLPCPAEIVSCRNGLLHLPTLELLSATPNFFGMNAVEFPFLPNAPKPVQWLKFLNQLWPEDPEAVRTLQEIMGYALTPDTRQQKLFLLEGPKRSGKGTIGRVITKLLGGDNVCAPTLSSLSANFGLAPLMGKQLAIISDARLGSRADQYAITERLLSISGEDGITIDRKFLPGWTGRLPTRFLVLTNELPRLADASGALASRFIVLTLQQSFYGKEDMGLTERLLGELPGIFNWSIEGWQRLQERAHFQQPASSKDAINELYDLGSPVGAFIRERCEIGAGHTVECGVLFKNWKEWCSEQGRDRPGTLQTFGRDLRAAAPGLKTTRSRTWEGRTRYYEGIGLA
jgi:putative DNA primase/helicase